MSTRQPVEQVTDRAKRYRANADAGDMPQVCMFCAATKDLQVDHLDGFEEHGEPENLIILCRSCNQLKSSVFKSAGLGRRTDQYNPFLGLFGEGGLLGSRTTHRDTGRAIARERDKAIRERERRAAKEEKRESMRAAREDLAEKQAHAVRAVSKYKGVTIYKRGDGSFFASLDPDSEFESLRDVKAVVDHFKNPASSAAEWRHAVAVLRGDIAGSPRQAVRAVRSTPLSRRLAYLRSVTARPNPPYAGGVPTFGQYAWGVSQHQKGKYIGSVGGVPKFDEGAHDEGGAIIRATPETVRRKYAARIADIKASHRRSAEDARWD